MKNGLFAVLLGLSFAGVYASTETATAKGETPVASTANVTPAKGGEASAPSTPGFFARLTGAKSSAPVVPEVSAVPVSVDTAATTASVVTSATPAAQSGFFSRMAAKAQDNSYGLKPAKDYWYISVPVIALGAAAAVWYKYFRNSKPAVVVKKQ